ncbi:hypothetical protein NIES932_16110 [Raphidiopsis curvata NIES-932]|nr:hypothetical protein NIES932_16110 [Raphidiopsis curvata NIES-932]
MLSSNSELTSTFYHGKFYDLIFGSSYRYAIQSQDADLKTLLDRGGATLKITGIAMDLLCLRPEFLTLLYVHDSTWFERHGGSLCFSDHEYNYDPSSRESWRSILDCEPFQSEGELAPHRCVATGAVSALLATQYLL